MNIHLPAILMFTRGTRFWHTAISSSWGYPKFQPSGTLKSTQSTRNPILVPKVSTFQRIFCWQNDSFQISKCGFRWLCGDGSIPTPIFLGTNIHVFSCENPENGMVLDPQIVIKRSIMVLGKRWQFHFGMFDFPGKSMVAPWSIHTHPAALEAPARIKPGAGARSVVMTNLVWKQHETAMVAWGSLMT